MENQIFDLVEPGGVGRGVVDANRRVGLKEFKQAITTLQSVECGAAKDAERLGLAGDVSREDFVALASNKIPKTKDQILTVGTKDKRTAGYDFCFSVPKSLSIYLAHTGNMEVERMIHESFRETMTDIETRMETRVRGRGENGEERDYNRTTGNLIYAAFIHTVTRPIDGIPDPHYHIHGFTFNATLDEEEDRWKAGQFMSPAFLLGTLHFCQQFDKKNRHFTVNKFPGTKRFRSRLDNFLLARSRKGLAQSGHR